MKIVPESHVAHGLSPEVLEHAVIATMRHIRETGDDPRVVTHTLEVPPEIPGADRLLCGLHGPVMGDDPVPTGEGWYAPRPPREYPSRLCARPPRPTRTVTVIAGPHDGEPWVLYTAFSGPLAPKETYDPTCRQQAESRAFWLEHALSAPTHGAAE